MVFGKRVKAFGVRIQKDRHLVDERACPSRANTVHPLVCAVVEECDLRVLAAKLDDDRGPRDISLYRLAARDHLLNEWKLQRFG